MTAESSVYETEPQDEAVGQDDFLNACVSVDTGLGPSGLLKACKDVEVELGRDLDAPRHAPRPIDIDVLLIDGREHNAPELRVPHAELFNRRFVLEPLLELQPPNRQLLEAALAEVSDQRVTRFGSF
ncbi:MAG: 2-amino-4-hydroxy-6-hydroxymethyldihydropteridine diphosphokinase [Thermoleophilaceae bacterium]|nr:2-amino-4-hydroxy-6-hydroxymethyldihydropteridine diphosphokinase [Thermoleophilaceae bacterium]